MLCVLAWHEHPVHLVFLQYLNQRSVYTRAHQVFADDFENPVLGHCSYHRD